MSALVLHVTIMVDVQTALMAIPALVIGDLAVHSVKLILVISIYISIFNLLRSYYKQITGIYLCFIINYFIKMGHIYLLTGNAAGHRFLARGFKPQPSFI